MLRPPTAAVFARPFATNADLCEGADVFAAGRGLPIATPERASSLAGPHNHTLLKQKTPHACHRRAR